nr:uncharacterized protein LOC129427910 isoform X2 [Misgurnus anguillicaudatus]
MNLRSPRSDVYTVRGFPQAKLSVSSSVIMDRDTVQLNCSNSENQKMDECYFIIDGRENKQSRSCQLSLTGSDIIKWSGGQRSSFIITCYYTLYISQEDTMPSPHSDPVTVHILTSTTTVGTTTTVMKTLSATVTKTQPTAVSTVKPTHKDVKKDTKSVLTVKPTHKDVEKDTKAWATSKAKVSSSTTTVGTTTTIMVTSDPQSTDNSGATPKAKEKRMLLIMLLAVACSVIVLTGLICLCGCACKKRSKRQRTAGDTRASGPADIYSLITSVPDTSQPTGLKQPQSQTKPETYSLITLTSQPSDLKQPQSHQQTKPETYSLITSTVQPSDVLDNTRYKKGHTEKDENVYHVYCTVPDKPKAVAKDQTYSLAI